MKLSFKEQELFFIDAIKYLGVTTADIKILSPTDISCKCPICGDSKFGNKKRLHFYEKGTVQNVNCFNGDCAVKNMSLYRFLKTYSASVFNQYRNHLKKRYFSDIINNRNDKNDEVLFNFDDILKPITDDMLSSFISDFKMSDEENDLKIISSFLKENPSLVLKFKELMSG